MFNRERAFAGMIAKGGAAPNAVVTLENTSKTTIELGRFIALSDVERGCKYCTKPTDVLIGVSTTLGITNSVDQRSSLVSVYRLTSADEMWVSTLDNVSFKGGIGSPVYVDTTENEGKATPDSTKGIPTQYIALAFDRKNNLVKITKK